LPDRTATSSLSWGPPPALSENGQGKEADEMVNRVTSTGSYTEALAVIQEYVEFE